MSRSFAKRYRFLSTNRFSKIYANRVVRRNKRFCTDGNAYKRLYESWNINDSGSSRPIPINEADPWIAKAHRK